MTSETPKLSRAEALAPWGFGALFALPVLLVRYPPMTDLPLHEAVVAAVIHRNDPAFVPPDLYLLNLGHPNQLFTLVAWPLALVVGTTWAMKLVVAAAELALFVCAARFAKHLGTPRWTALLVGTLGFGWLFYWGLLANMIGVAALLAVIPTLDRFVAKPSVKGALASFACLVLLFLAHETVMLCACLMMGLFALGYGVTRLLPVRLIPALGAFGVGVLHLWWAQRMRPPHNASIPLLFHTFGHKLEIIPGVLFAGYTPYVRTLMFAIAVLAMVLFAVERWRQRPGFRGTPRRELYLRYRFEIFAGCLLVAYFVFPFTLSGATLFYHRFFPPAYAILAVVLAPSALPTWRVSRFAAATVPVASILIAWPSFLDSDKVAKDFDAMVDRTEYNSSYVVVDIGPKPPERLFSNSPLEGHAVARHGGRVLFDFTQSPISVAFLNPKYQWNDPYARLNREPILIRPEYDLDRFRYLFFHTTKEEWGFAAEEALQGDAKLLAHKGEWFLFESTHLKYGLLSPDMPLPPHKYHTLRKRMKDVFRRDAGLPIPPDPLLEPPTGASHEPDDPAAHDTPMDDPMSPQAARK